MHSECEIQNPNTRRRSISDLRGSQTFAGGRLFEIAREKIYGRVLIGCLGEIAFCLCKLRRSEKLRSSCILFSYLYIGRRCFHYNYRLFYDKVCLFCVLLNFFWWNIFTKITLQKVEYCFLFKASGLQFVKPWMGKLF